MLERSALGLCFLVLTPHLPAVLVSVMMALSFAALTVYLYFRSDFRLQRSASVCSFIVGSRIVVPVFSYFLRFLVAGLLLLYILGIQFLKLCFQVMEFALQIKQISSAQTLVLAVYDCVSICCNEMGKRGVSREALCC